MGDVTTRKRINDRLRDAEIGKRNYLKCSLFERLGEILRPLVAKRHTEGNGTSRVAFGQPDRRTVAGAPPFCRHFSHWRLPAPSPTENAPPGRRGASGVTTGRRDMYLYICGSVGGR